MLTKRLNFSVMKVWVTQSGKPRSADLVLRAKGIRVDSEESREDYLFL